MSNDLYPPPEHAVPPSGITAGDLHGGPEPRPRKPRRTGLWIGIAAGILVLAAAAAVIVMSLTPDRFAEATAACDTAGTVAHVGDGGQTLILEGGKYGQGTAETMCILVRLNVSEAVTQQMSTTRALDGRQEGSWPGYEASWTDHPDNGLDVIVTKAG